MNLYNTKGLSIVQLSALILIGVASYFAPLVITSIWAFVFIITIVASLSGRQDWIWYCIAASPILEIWGRMVKGTYLLDEMGKYYLLLAIAAILLHHIKERTSPPLYHTGAFILFLIAPSLIANLGDFDREQWVFNILGLIELAVLLILISRERWYIERYARTLQFGLMPVFCMLTYLIIKSPSLSNVNFLLGANFKTSAGSSNQVATALGLGIVYTMLLLLLKRPIVKWKWVCYMLIAILFFRSFLTFSRGGVFASIVSILIAIGYAMFVNRKTFLRYSAIMLVFAAACFFVFIKVDEMTGHKLSQRYSGETEATITGAQEKTWNKVTSGRSSMVKADWNIFLSDPAFGVGPGGAKGLRYKYGVPADAAAHTEFTRLLSEHGIGGMAAGLLLCIFPIFWLRKQRYRLWKGVSASLFCLAIFTATHSAMRTNTTIVCYALAAIPVYIRNRKLAATTPHTIHRQ